jgi:excisionase family DNA binding protein
MEELLNPKELARILKVSQVTIYKWAERGIISSYKLEGVLRFSPDDVMNFLQKRRKDGQKIVNDTAKL